MSSGMVQHRILAFEILHLFAHHGKVKLNEVLMTADDSQEVKFELVQHLNVDQTTTLTSRSAITAKLCCSVCKLWQKYKCEKRACNIALSYSTQDISKCRTI